MGRARYAVVVMVPRPIATEVDGMRKAFGDTSLARIAPHTTLIPPVNVRDEDRAAAIAAVDAAAAANTPFTAKLGPATTFFPASPVLYLSVGDDDAVAALDALRETVFVAPLARPIGHAFVPHVTLGRERGPAERLHAGVAALSEYEAPFLVDRITLMELLDSGPEHGAQVWTAVHEAPLGGPAVVAVGGLPVELTATAVVDDDALALLEVERVAERRPPRGRVVITARRDGELLGVLVGRKVAEWSAIDELVVVEQHRRQGVVGHLQRAFGDSDLWG